METVSPSHVNRRQFVAAAAVVGTCLCVLGSEAQAGPATGPSVVDVGLKTDFAKDGLNFSFVKAKHLIVGRENGKIFAMSSLCPHAGCDVSEIQGTLGCHCHHSLFTDDGTVTKGPARRSLAHYAISVNDDGHLIVDMSQKFDDKHYTDPNSFVSVDPA